VTEASLGQASVACESTRKKLVSLKEIVHIVSAAQHMLSILTYLHDLLQQGQLLSISTLQQDSAPQGAGTALEEHERARPSSASIL